MIVAQGQRAGHDPLSGHARAGPDGSASTARCSGSSSSRPQNVLVKLQRQPREAAARGQGAGRLRDGEEDLRRRRGLSPSDARPRAAIVVTGSELVRGERTDLNGPFLARSLLALGRRAGADRRRRRRSGGARGGRARGRRRRRPASRLGRSRADARRPHGRARRAGSPGGRSRVDEELEAQIEDVSRMVAERMRRPYADFAAGRAQAGDRARGRGRRSGSPARRPASWSRRAGRRSSCCPGRRRSCSGSGRARSRPTPCAACSTAGTPPLRRTLRFFGPGESQVAQAFQEAGGDGDGLEVTICARDFEIHVDLVVEPGAEGRADRARAGASRAARPVPLLDRRPHGRGDRARPLPRARLDARHRRVVHRRPRRRAPDRDPRLDATSSLGGIVALRERGQGRRARRAGRADRGARRRLGRGRGGDGARRPRAARRRRRGLGDGRSPARAAAPRRSPSGSSTSTRRRPRASQGGSSSASRATATRSGAARSSPSLHLVRRLLEQNRDEAV